MNENWTWANLSNDQLRMVKEAEQVLGPEYLLAYQHNGHGHSITMPQGAVKTAALDESQVECLQGLEQKVQAVIVAYGNRID